MTRKHHSHFIFGLLGLLVLLFIIVFGVRYLVARYGYQEVPGGEAEAYEDGRLSENPFTDPVDQFVDRSTWKTFSSGSLAFSYPEDLALAVMNSRTVMIAPNKEALEPRSCDGIDDEQARADCQRPPMSPNITIKVSDETTTPTGAMISIDGTDWYVDRYQDEYGGSTWYRRSVASGTLEISYRHWDTLGGVSFETMASEYGKQYRLNAREQDDLTRSIISTLVVK